MNITYALGKGTYLSNRYRIDEIIGQGGFGITYVAYDEAEGKKCAVKEYFPRDSAVRLSNGKEVKTVSDEKIEIFNHGLTRFMEEADVLWKLQGVESVVSVYDRFKENGTGYYVMEYVDGVTLKKLVRENGKLKFKYVNKILFVTFAPKSYFCVKLFQHSFNIHTRLWQHSNMKYLKIGKE